MKERLSFGASVSSGGGGLVIAGVERKDKELHRRCELGGDWYDAWNDDGDTQYIDLGPRPKAAPDWLQGNPEIQSRRIL